MTARTLLGEFVRRSAARQNAYDHCLLDYYFDLALSHDGTGTSEPLQHIWDIARRYALQAAIEGRCEPSEVPTEPPVVLVSRELLLNRIRSVREAKERRRTDGYSCPIADLAAEEGLLATSALSATRSPVVALRHVGGRLRAVDVTSSNAAETDDDQNS